MKKLVALICVLSCLINRADWPGASQHLTDTQRAAAIAKQIPESVKQVLDDIFKSTSGAFTEAELKKLGFKIISWRSPFPAFNDLWIGEVAVVEHPSLPGYLLKIPQEGAHAATIARNLTRISVSEKMRQIIADNDLNIDVPEKWSYLAHELPVVIAQKLHLDPPVVSELGTKTHNDVLWAAHKVGLWDLHNGNVIPVGGMDRVSVIDTERFNLAVLSPVQQLIGDDAMAAAVLGRTYKNKQYRWFDPRRYRYADSAADFKPLAYGVGAVAVLGACVTWIQHSVEVGRIDNVMTALTDSLDKLVKGEDATLADTEITLACKQAFRQYQAKDECVDDAFVASIKKVSALNKQIAEHRNLIKRAELLIDDAFFQPGFFIFPDINQGPVIRSMYLKNYFMKRKSEADRDQNLASQVPAVKREITEELCKTFTQYIALCAQLDEYKKEYKQIVNELKAKVLATSSWYCKMKNSIKKSLGFA